MPHFYQEFIMLLVLAVALVCFAFWIRHKVHQWNGEFKKKMDTLIAEDKDVFTLLEFYRTRCTTLESELEMERITKRMPTIITTEIVEQLAFRTLWIAYAWNDHNFEPAHVVARETCEKLGITSLEQAQNLLNSSISDASLNNKINECIAVARHFPESTRGNTLDKLSALLKNKIMGV